MKKQVLPRGYLGAVDTKAFKYTKDGARAIPPVKYEEDLIRLSHHLNEIL
jgi:hypothetical protein